MCQKQVQVPTIFQENQLFSQKDATHQTYKGNMRNEKHKKNDTNLCFVDAADSESQDHAKHIARFIGDGRRCVYFDRVEAQREP